MKKQQKIIEINNEKNIKLVYEQEEYAKERARFASERYSVKSECAKLLRGVTDENRRGDILATRAAEIAEIDMRERESEAKHKSFVSLIYSVAAKKIAAAEDDPEPENQQTENKQPAEEPAVWVDGRQHTAVIVARRMLRKLPRVAPGCSFNISVRHFGDDISIELEAYNPKRVGYSFESVILRSDMTAEEQEKAVAEWLERSAALIKYEGNSHVAEPISSALDAVFGGNPVEQVDNLISDTIKDVRKEGCNE